MDPELFASGEADASGPAVNDTQWVQCSPPHAQSRKAENIAVELVGVRHIRTRQRKIASDQLVIPSSRIRLSHHSTGDQHLSVFS